MGNVKLTKMTAAALARRWRRRSGTWWWAIVVIVAPVTLIAAAAVTILLMLIDAGDPKNQIDLIKTGLTVGAGTGGIVALVLNGRKQWANEHDATERRLTELFLKAVDQLGSDQPAIRHGGLYGLERVGQNNPNQRQIVADVICAYLRGPFEPPRDDRKRTLRNYREHGELLLPLQNSSTFADARQEREVRLTAQRILSKHLRPGNDPLHPDEIFWKNIDIDLTGATLIDLDFAHCRIRTGHFERSVFVGETRFRRAHFEDADFARCKFEWATNFIGVNFANCPWFSYATFDWLTTFRLASFPDGAVFTGATFSGLTAFDKARFDKSPSFKDVKFFKVDFSAATFPEGVELTDARFGDTATFDDVDFGIKPDLSGALARVDQLSSPHSWPAGWAGDFGAVTPLSDAPGLWGHLVESPAASEPDDSVTPADRVARPDDAKPPTT